MPSNDVIRHEELIPMGTQVSSKSRYRNCKGIGPEWSAYGLGVYVDGLLDNSCGLGALTIGHVTECENVKPRCLPLPSMAELMLAEMLREWVPCAESSRFMKTGTDATSACVRLARVFTGRDIIVDAGNYHGCADWSVSGEHEGVPQCVRDLTKRVPYNDMEALEDELLGNKAACVILEPVSLTAPYDWYLPRLRKLCDDTGTVLIFDEVITGIRMAKGGAQEVYGVTPDICAIGKGLANGYPISAVCGKKWIMECFSRTHLSGTHFGDPSCMEAAIETMCYLEKKDFWGHQTYIGSMMLDGVKSLIEKHGVAAYAKAVGHPHWWVLQIPDPAHQTLTQQTLIENGVLGSNGSHFVSLAHGEQEVSKSLAAYDAAFAILRDAINTDTVHAHIKCELNRVSFRRH